MHRRLQQHAVSIAAFAVLLILTTASCRKREAPADAPPAQAPLPTAPAAALRITDVQLGNAIGADKKVTEARETFSPKDTIFASVATEGSAPNATLRAKWTYQDGQTVEETSRSISSTGPAVTEFSIQKPDGLPAGDYRLEIFRDGQSVATRSFKVQ